MHAIFCVLCLPLLFWIWKHQAARGREPGDLSKIGTGAWLSAASNLVLVGAILFSGGSPIHPSGRSCTAPDWGSPSCTTGRRCALVSRAAPARVNSTLMGLCYIVMGLANLLIGWVGGFYKRCVRPRFGPCMPPSVRLAELLVLLFGGDLGRLLQPR